MSYTKGKWETRQKRGNNQHEYLLEINHRQNVIAEIEFMRKGDAEANARLIAAAPEMAGASKDFLDGWLHFCNCIDFGKSNLDADAIRFMNEVPGKIETAYKAAIAEGG